MEDIVLPTGLILKLCKYALNIDSSKKILNI